MTRFLALSVCLLGLGACGDRPADAPPAENNAAADAALEQRLAAAAALTDRLEAVRAVKRLQHAYGQYAEFGLWHDLADLFSKDAVGHYPAGDLGKTATYCAPPESCRDRDRQPLLHPGLLALQQ